MAEKEGRHNLDRAVQPHGSTGAERQAPEAGLSEESLSRTVQRAQVNPHAMSPQNVQRLQRTVGNQAVNRLLPQGVQRRSVQMVSQSNPVSQPMIQRTIKDARKWIKDNKNDLAEHTWSSPVKVSEVKSYIKNKKKLWEKLKEEHKKKPVAETTDKKRRWQDLGDEKPHKKRKTQGKQGDKTIVFDDVGKSDDEYESESEYGFVLDKPLKPSATTLKTKDGVLKGGQLLSLVHDAVKSQIEEMGGGKYSYQETTQLEIVGGGDWLKGAGLMAITPTSIDALPPGKKEERKEQLKKRAISSKGRKKPIYVGTEKSLMKVRYWVNNTERLSLDSQLDKGDEYTSVVDKIELIKQENSLTDPQLAVILQERLTTGYGPSLKQPKDLLENVEDYLNLINALMCGVEGSRMNVTYGTAPMKLEAIAAGKETFKQALADPSLRIDGVNYGGQFSMATNKSGTGSLSKQKELIQDKTGSMQEARKNPQQFAVPLKNVITIKNFLKSKGINRDSSKEEISQVIRDFVKQVYPPKVTYEDVLSYLEEKLSKKDWEGFVAFMDGTTSEENWNSFNQAIDLLDSTQTIAFLYQL